MSDGYSAVHERRAGAAAPVPVTQEMERAVGDTLSAAFADDPVVSWFLRGDEARDGARRQMIGTLVERYREQGWAMAAKDGSCATLWARPGRTASPMGLLDQLRLLPRMVRMCSLARVPRVFKVMSALEEHHPKAPDHFYLFMIGVSPAFQGQGLGSSILEATLRDVDREGAHAYLENTNAKNTPLYERHGFKVTNEVTLGPNAPTFWPMWRDARN